MNAGVPSRLQIGFVPVPMVSAVHRHVDFLPEHCDMSSVARTGDAGDACKVCRERLLGPETRLEGDAGLTYGTVAKVLRITVQARRCSRLFEVCIVATRFGQAGVRGSTQLGRRRVRHILHEHRLRSSARSIRSQLAPRPPALGCTTRRSTVLRPGGGSDAPCRQHDGVIIIITYGHSAERGNGNSAEFRAPPNIFFENQF